MSSPERSSRRPPGLVYRFGPHELDLIRYELRRRGTRLSIPKIPLDLLVILVQGAGQLITREELVAELWGEKAGLVDTRSALNNAVNRLRSCLNDVPENPRYIETVIGRGYRFISKVDCSSKGGESPVVKSEDEMLVAPAIHPAQIQVQEEVRQVEPATSTIEIKTRRRLLTRWMLAGSAVGLMTVGVFLYWHLTHWHQEYRMIQVTTNDGSAVQVAALSPAGDKLVYADESGIFLRSLANGVTRRLGFPKRWTTEKLAWKPDGQEIVASGHLAIAEEWAIWSCRIEDETAREILPDARLPSVSPDGQSIASTNAEQSEILLSKLDGTERKVFSASEDRGRVISLAWSSDQRLLLALEELPGALPKGGLGPRQSAPYLPRRYVARDLATKRILATEELDGFDAMANPVQNNQLLLTNNHVLDQYGMWQVRLDQSGRFRSRATLLLPSFGLIDSLTVGKGGAPMAAVVEKGEADVYTAHFTNGRLQSRRRLTLDSRVDFPNAWLPDGRSVLFESDRSGQFRIYSQDLEESEPKVLTSEPGEQVAAILTTDGQHILYHQVNGTQTKRWAGIYRISINGGTSTKVPMHSDADEVRCAAAAPICVERYVSAIRKISFYRFDPWSGTQNLLVSGGSEVIVFGDWDLSPDGGTVAMPVHQPDHPEIELIPTDARSSRKRVRVQASGQVWNLRWSPSGLGWYGEIRTATSHRLCWISLVGEIKELYQSPYNIWAVPSPDGQQIALLDYTSNRNVWMWRQQ